MISIALTIFIKRSMDSVFRFRCIFFLNVNGKMYQRMKGNKGVPLMYKIFTS